jgi:large subunit ribosomal protein L23
MNLAHIIKKPVITEKSLSITKDNRYTFEVDVLSTKGQIKEAVEHFFNVDVISVRTVKIPGVIKRTGRRRLPKVMGDTKKAIVEIKPGQSIKAFEIKG